MDCSLLTPPWTGPDGRARYLMLETLRAYGRTGWPRPARPGAAAAMARYALQVAEQAAAGLAQHRGGGRRRWLDAEEATIHQALAWATEDDRPSRCGWRSRWRRGGTCAAGRRARYPLLRALPARLRRQRPVVRGASLARPDGAATRLLTGALGHFTAVHDAVAALPPSRALVDGLAGRSE